VEYLKGYVLDNAGKHEVEGTSSPGRFFTLTISVSGFQVPLEFGKSS
jgi:hypothetical protein